MDKDLRDLLRAWLSDSIDESRMEPILTRLREDTDFRDAFVAELVLIGQIKALQVNPEPRPHKQRQRSQPRTGWYPKAIRPAARCHDVQ
jgi:hypothetical protein